MDAGAGGDHDVVGALDQLRVGRHEVRGRAGQRREKEQEGEEDRTHEWDK
jgi:hypothetical protein